MSFLEYQDEMYLSAVNDDACLVVMSRGIGLEQLMVRLCRTYSDDTNLVIVIGTDPDDELYFTNQLLDETEVPYGKLPQRITSESSNAKKRAEIYLKGGILFVTERILVVDLLSDRVPFDLITGIIIYKAHKIYNDCLMSFIIRLFRMKNKKGFIKALSQSPQNFLGDYGKLDRIMRALFVTTLHLWPRFHATVQSSLAKPKAQPDVIEINLTMSPAMKNIQFDIMDLIDMCLKELSKTNTAFLYDSDQLNVENAINRSFDGFIKRRFDEIWHQLGSKAKRLINDIQWLRNLLHLLTRCDAETFYNQTRAAQNSVRLGSEISDWIFWKPADRLFKLSKERSQNEPGKPKWKALQNLIDEIGRENINSIEKVHIFIIVANDCVAPEAELTLNNTKLQVHIFATRDKATVLDMKLISYKPLHVIMFDLDMHIIRQIEVYQALHCHPNRCKVYTIQFENSFDMQKYLTSLRREKEAFENLIKEKATMVIPTGRDGKTDGHPDLIRGDWKANETTDAVNTRRAGGQVDRTDIIRQKILVDMREFRCDLPANIHKRGIEIEPIQLEIGDYILSSDTCVERKSVSDLIQSLQSGRLFSQAAMMIRHFKRSVLLIEFDENKSFHFKGRYWGVISKAGYVPSKKDNSMDLVERLILLTIHHPFLRIVWSPSTHFTAELFEYLKVDRDQPDAQKIASISSEELPPETFEDVYDIQAKDFLLKLPGVNTRNVYSLMNCVPTLADLVNVSVEELHEIMGNSRSAELLHQTLHSSLKGIASDAIRAEQESRKSRLFHCSKRRKGLV